MAKIEPGTGTIPADLTALLADVGDASASTLGSLYAILGNPTSTVSGLQGLVYRASVTTYTDTTHFKTTDLIGFGDDFFNDYYVYVVRDAGGLGAAPQGESQQVSDYTSADGTITHTAFTTPLAVTDIVLLLNPNAATVTVLGGATYNTATDSLEVIAADVAEILDMTQTESLVAVTNVETDLFLGNPAVTTNGLVLKVDLTNMIAGDTYVIREKYQITAAGTYFQVSDDAANTFVGVQTQKMKVIHLEAYRHGCRITAQRLAGGDRSFQVEVIIEG